MKTKAIVKILIILIVLILIVGGVFAYLYLGTDLLKTNEQLFYKYLGQIVEQENGFFDSKLKEYENKKMTGKYEDNGQFSVNIDMAGMDEDMLAKVNDFNITYSGKIDNTARKNEQEISINYSDEVNFPLKYKYANETIGLQTKYVSAKYIGIENNNLKEFAENLGMTENDDIPDTIDFFTQDTFQSITFTDEEREQLKNTYKSVLEGKLEGKEFTKSENSNTINYSVEMTNQELTDIILAFLETLKNDQVLLPKLEQSFQEYLEIMNQSSTEEVTVQSIVQNMIEKLNSSDVQDGTTKITVSQTDKMLTGITFAVDGTEIKLTKTNNQDNLTYRIELNEQDEELQSATTMYLNASYQGLEQLTTVNENYEIGINISQNGKERNLIYNFNCTDTFNDNINIEDYSEDEIEVLNEYDSEQMATLFTAIGERITEVNASQMEEIGFSEYGNPMLYLLPKIAMISMAYQESEAMEEDIEEALNNTEIQAFNQIFEQYEGTQRGTTVMSLLQSVVYNNISETDEDRKVEVTGDITMSKDETEVPRDSIETSSTYNVQLEYTEGLISQIIITQE